MTDSPPPDGAPADSYPVELTRSELSTVRTALELLLQSLAREEAGQVEQVKALLANLPNPPA
ncbi:MAG: hypothetical protein ACJ761_04070 [Chloroflexota bacterium]